MLERKIGSETYHMHSASVRGRKFFHRRCIRWSYRNRGYEARTHRNKDVRIRVFTMKFEVKISGWLWLLRGAINRMEDRAFIRIILVYSAMKNKAKGPAEYSTLNPETSSDSPSVRSKGARFVSASVEMYHIMAKGQVGIISHVCSWVVIRVCREKEPFINRIDSRIMAIVTS